MRDRASPRVKLFLPATGMEELFWSVDLTAGVCGPFWAGCCAEAATVRRPRAAKANRGLRICTPLMFARVDISRATRGPSRCSAFRHPDKKKPGAGPGFFHRVIVIPCRPRPGRRPACHLGLRPAGRLGPACCLDPAGRLAVRLGPAVRFADRADHCPGSPSCPRLVAFPARWERAKSQVVPAHGANSGLESPFGRLCME